jgi:hypothetical protein
MLLAMVDDIRVVLVKLAERTQALRYLMNADERLRQQTAREVQDVFAPLANRLGIWQLKWELEDLTLRALESAEYKKIAKLLDERRQDRQRYIDHVISILRDELEGAGIKSEISGRPKHIYSIWSKMRRKPGGIEAIYDIRAVRILVDSVKDCYEVLGLVHHLWTPLPKEFDDYIAKPKANNYRSLHTAVIGPEGKPLEVQIRTWEMHQHSEYGVAAHWRYKEADAKGARHDPGFNDKIAWLRQILDWKDAVADSSDLLAAFKSSLFTDSIYVLTPQGKVIDAAWRDRFRVVHESVIAAAARAWTATWCRSTTCSRTASKSISSRPSRADPRATGSIPISATCTAIARERRCASGSRPSNSTRRSRRAGRWSSASSRVSGRRRSSWRRWPRRQASPRSTNFSPRTRGTTSTRGKYKRRSMRWRSPLLPLRRRQPNPKSSRKRAAPAVRAAAFSSSASTG